MYIHVPDMKRIVAILGVVGVVGLTASCESLDGRNRVRKGNRLFKDSCFVASAAEYEKSMTEIDDPILHYNLGLALHKLGSSRAPTSRSCWTSRARSRAT